MSSEILISARDLTKTFRIFGHPGDRIKQALTLGRLRFHREFTALKNVSFDIRKGEMVGIIGRNGSGKSTLLQLVCGILKPTSGTVEVNGRVSALLELGAGFNPEFTGRENVYFQGALMGITKSEMGERFDQISAFADIGAFIDQPVRTYSSGMFVRLAFSVAVHVDPEILVVDEALAVGDAGFRSRCFRRIAELRNAGCTILFVSHAMEEIVRLCGRTILLDEGDLLLSGQPEAVVAQFQHLLSMEPGVRERVREEIRASVAGRPIGAAVPANDDRGPSAESAVAYEPNGAIIESVGIVDTAGLPVRQLRRGRAYRCVYRVCFMQEATHVRCAMLVKTPGGVDLGGAMSAPSTDKGVPNIPKGGTVDVAFEFNCMLNPGAYLVSVAVFGSEAGVEYALHGIQGALTFRVAEDPDRSAIGPVDFGCRATVQLANAAVA